MTGDSEGQQLKLGSRPPSIHRPKLHRACGLAYRCSVEESKEKEGGDVALLYVQRFHFSGDRVSFFVLYYG